MNSCKCLICLVFSDRRSGTHSAKDAISPDGAPSPLFPPGFNDSGPATLQDGIRNGRTGPLR